MPETLDGSPCTTIPACLRRLRQDPYVIAIKIGTTIKRGQELGLIRTDLPNELLMAWFRAIDGAGDDWLLAHLDHLDQTAITHIARQTITTIRQALAPPTSITP